MRPGLKAREGGTRRVELADLLEASMRPGLKAREGSFMRSSTLRTACGFNEARA